MKFNTALRPWVNRRLEEIEHADIVIGIPCFNNDSTIAHVIRTASEGIGRYYRNFKSVIIVSDGGSTDDTREVAEATPVQPFIEKIVAIYRGLPGKGTALRMIFEAVKNLEARACVVCDSDLRSITPEWVKALIDPVLEKDFHFVAPLYSRYKYDATITNNIAYNLTRALFGKQIRQPIGGDFGFSRDLADYYRRQDVWQTEVAKFGIDIWMTVSAIMEGFPICQSYLGTKVHDAKDPAVSLGPMFSQVVYTLFSLIEKYYDKWSAITRSEPVPIFGEPIPTKPEAFNVNLPLMLRRFKEGFENFGVLWKGILAEENFARLREIYRQDEASFSFPTELWARIVYDFAATFHNWRGNRYQLVDIMSPLYYGRVANFVIKTSNMTDLEAEEVVHEQARVFEDLKPYLIKRCEEKSLETLPN